MFKLQLQYNNQGEFIDTVYPPCDYQRVSYLLNQYTQRWGNVHTYRVIQLPNDPCTQALHTDKVLLNIHSN